MDRNFYRPATNVDIRVTVINGVAVFGVTATEPMVQNRPEKAVSLTS